jgi:hypothetical protein
MSEFMCLPSPYAHLTGSPVFGLRDGEGWLGYECSPCTSQIWFLSCRTGFARPLLHDEVFTAEDRWTGDFWIIFFRRDTDELLPYLLCPGPGDVHHPVDPALREFLGEDG